MFSQKLRPLVFLHIAKTSATAALRLLFSDAITSGGNLSVACLASQPSADDVLYHGHPEHDAAWAVPRGAVAATVLRTPAARAASNYQHLLRNPHLPLHDLAMQLGFSGLMRAVPSLLAFQAVPLGVAISMKPLQPPDEFFARFRRAKQHLPVLTPSIRPQLDLDSRPTLGELELRSGGTGRRASRRAEQKNRE